MRESAYNSSFPSAPLPHPSNPSFSSLPVPSDASDPQTSIQTIDYPSVLSSSPTLSNCSSTTPSLQQTSFTFPTPPPSSSSSPQPLLSSSPPSTHTYHTLPETMSPHTPTGASFPPQHQLSAHPVLAQPTQPLQAGPMANGSNSPSDQSSAAFIYPHILPANPDPAPHLPNQNHPPPHALSYSLPAHGAGPPFAFHNVPPHMQNLSFPNVPANPPHPAMHLPNLGHQAPAPSLTAAFPPTSFTHPSSSSSLPHPSFQASSCLAMPSAFQQSVSSAPPHPPAAHLQSLPNASSSASSYPSVDIGAMPQFNPPAPYRPEMVLHHSSFHPQLDPSIPSSNPGPALYPAFPSYPLRLCQDPDSSLSIPFRHLYRQHQHGHAHPQGTYLDMGTRPKF